MKCKNCGAELTMLEKFCPNCGTPNEQSQQHIKDMEHYEHEFSDTQKEVVRNSKWFIKYIAGDCGNCSSHSNHSGKSPLGI